MHRRQLMPLAGSCVAAVALLTAGSCKGPAPELEETWIEEPAELRVAYAIEVDDERSAGGVRRAAQDFRFRSGDKFRLALDADFEAYAYLFHRSEGDPSYVRLFPHPRIAVKVPLPGDQATRIPADEQRWTLDTDKGLEHLVLVVSSAPWAIEAGSGGSLWRDAFERQLAELEMSRRPGSYSATEEDGWTKLFFDGEMRDAAIVARIPMSHR
ncbi:MAG: DUF4384 domain-containing protein [Bryobacterales bacterium]|nr:DUF4384 domain-containing protein [Bryobacterales bacterium]